MVFSTKMQQGFTAWRYSRFMQKKHFPQGASVAAVDLWLGSAVYTPFYHGDTQLYDNTINSGCPMSIKNKFN